MTITLLDGDLALTIAPERGAEARSTPSNRIRPMNPANPTDSSRQIRC